MSELASAINSANVMATNLNIPYGVAYFSGRGWTPYDLRRGTKGTPEYICFGLGKLPLHLSDEAADAFASLIRAKARSLDSDRATQRRAQSDGARST